jgi:hypothetical protein
MLCNLILLVCNKGSYGKADISAAAAEIEAFNTAGDGPAVVVPMIAAGA